MLYYLKFSIVNNTLPINASSIGQRDINPSIQSVTIRTLEAQKYDSDLNNPSNLLLGNIDFSFVLIFLFPCLSLPLLTISSPKKKRGTWRIVLIQSQSPFMFIFQLFAIRFLMVLLVLLITLFSTVIFLGIPLNSVFWTYLITSILYLIFWFGVCFGWLLCIKVLILMRCFRFQYGYF